MSSESYVVCEGFHDRAFWAGWLLRVGCVDPGVKPSGGRQDVVDPWKTKVAGGQFGFNSKSGRFIRVVPVNGIGNILRAVKVRLREHGSKSLDQLIINTDSDQGPSIESIEKLLRDFDPTATLDVNHACTLFDRRVGVHVVKWNAEDAASNALPEAQTLERLVCAAIIAAYPDRGNNVQRWLEGRASPPVRTVKEFAWSHMAGWYADRGCEAFYRAIWEDPAIVQQLRQRLERMNQWAMIEQLAS